jgi:monoamine oxidase
MEQRIRPGTKVIVVGAGLAGLTAAVRLMQMGAKISLIEARDRVGGRVLTIRGAFAQGQHAEAGGDFIDEDQHEIIRLVKEQRLTLRPILRQGFTFVRHPGPSRRRRHILSGEGRGIHCLMRSVRWWLPIEWPTNDGTVRSPDNWLSNRWPNGWRRSRPTAT